MSVLCKKTSGGKSYRYLACRTEHDLKTVCALPNFKETERSKSIFSSCSDKKMNGNSQGSFSTCCLCMISMWLWLIPDYSINVCIWTSALCRFVELALD